MDLTLIDKEDKKFEEVNNLPAVRTIDVGSLVPNAYDKITITYTGSDISSVGYYQDGILKSTLNLTYSNGKLVSIEKV